VGFELSGNLMIVACYQRNSYNSLHSWLEGSGLNIKTGLYNILNRRLELKNLKSKYWVIK